LSAHAIVAGGITPRSNEDITTATPNAAIGFLFCFVLLSLFMNSQPFVLRISLSFN
jgi:hypothetical protein